MQKRCKLNVNVRFPVELLSILNADAKARGISRSELLRSLVQRYYEEKAVLSDKLKRALSALEAEGRA